MRRYTKSVMFKKNGRGVVRQIVSIRVPGHNRVLNAPPAVLHINELDCRPVKLGF